MTATVAAPSRRSVLLIDDHRVFTDVLAYALDAQPDLRCVAVANTAADGLAQAEAYDIDVAIVDLHLPDGDGLAVIGRLRRIRPQARLIVLTGHPTPDLATAARHAGAYAFLAKDDALHAVLDVIRGTRPPTAVDEEAPDGPSLTTREREVLTRLAAGADARRIARDLDLSIHTVRGHIKAIRAKFGVHSQHAAVAAARDRGLVAGLGRPS